MPVPMMPMTSIETKNMSRRTPTSRTGSVIVPVMPSDVSSPHATNEPTMKISPWAKLMSSMIP